MESLTGTAESTTGTKRAAVTLITDGNSIVFIKRKERDGDPWSGNIAFPGGYVKDGESDMEASLRECVEEIGFRPSKSAFYGFYKPHLRNLTVSAFVDIEPLVHDYIAGDEVDEVFILDTSELRSSVTEFNFPCYEAQGRVVWGLTYRILQDYLAKQS